MPRGKTSTKQCPLCLKDVSKFAFKRHFESCSGPKIIKPRVAWNKGLTKDSDERVAKNGASVSKTLKMNPKHGCCSWSTEERSNRAKIQGFGGYRETAGRSKKFRVLDSFGNQVTLQSSFEFRCSKILDSLGVRWIRPKHLKYNGGKKYFADFFLVDCNIWLDPKNDYKAKQDADKIQSVIEDNRIRLIVLNEDQITEEFIGRLVKMD